MVVSKKVKCNKPLASLYLIWFNARKQGTRGLGLFKPIHFFKQRKLRVDILTLFLSLTIVSFALVISFGYITNYQSILEFSKGTIIRASDRVLDRIEFLGFDTQETVDDFSALFAEPLDFSLDDEKLIFYMFNAVKANTNLSALFVAAPDGRVLVVTDLFLSQQKFYLTQKEKPLPPQAAYAIQIVDPKKTPSEVWYYRDKNSKPLGQETVTTPLSHALSRPWYEGALQTKDFFWTDIYSFAGTPEVLDVTISKAVYDKEGHLLCVIGADITFFYLHEFLKKQTIGKSGHVFIIDKKDETIVSGLEGDAERAADKQVKEALAIYHSENKSQFTFISEGNKYLAHIGQIPAGFGKDWHLVVLVPFNDFFLGLIHTQILIVAITLVILAIVGLITFVFAQKIANPIVSLVKEIGQLTHLKLKSEKRVSSHIEEINLLDQAIASLRQALLSFMRYVPKDIVRHLLESGKAVALGGEKQEVTIFFSDIQGFTPLVEKNETDFIMPLLAEYFDGLSKTILRERGTIDKYVGDSIMAFWGAPQEMPEHAYHACLAALHGHNFVEQFNQKRRELKQPEFLTRFGIHTGVVVVGNIGTIERMNYTVIGDAVNTTSRLQAAAKNYHVPILISEETYKCIDKDFLTRPLDEIELKGREKKIRIYELMAIKKPGPLSATEQQIDLANRFTEAYHLLEAGSRSKAQEILSALAAQYPNDYPTKRLLS